MLIMIPFLVPGTKLITDDSWKSLLLRFTEFVTISLFRFRFSFGSTEDIGKSLVRDKLNQNWDVDGKKTFFEDNIFYRKINLDFPLFWIKSFIQ